MHFNAAFLAVVCVSALGCQTEPNGDETQQEKAIAGIKELGGVIILDENDPQKPVVEIDIARRIPKEALTHLQAFPKLQRLFLCFAHLDDQSLRVLKDMVNLKELDLTGNHITDEGLANLKRLKNVERLFLASTHVTDRALEDVKMFPRLQWLDVSDTSVTDSGLTHLKGLPNLEHVGLDHTRISDAGIAHLKPLTKLRFLEVADNNITDSPTRGWNRSTR
jgi:Leucine Rich repeat